MRDRALCCFGKSEFRGAEIMAHLLGVLLLVMATLGVQSDICPNADDLKPCTCNEKGINCNGVTDLDDLVRSLNSYMDDAVIDAVWIQETTFDHLPENLFAKYMISTFHLNDNQLTEFTFKTLTGSENTAESINLSGNKLHGFPFKDITMLPKLSVLDVERNEIKELTPFPSHAGLRLLDISDNQLTSIPARAFAALPNLVRVDLGNNRFTTLGPESLATGHSILRIILNQNQISDIDERAMEGMWSPSLDLVDNKLTVIKESVFRKAFSVVTQHGGKINIKGNPLSCTGCDYKWIVASRPTVKRVFSNFQCVDERGLDDLTEENISC